MPSNILITTALKDTIVNPNRFLILDDHPSGTRSSNKKVFMSSISPPQISRRVAALKLIRSEFMLKTTVNHSLATTEEEVDRG